MRRKKSEVRSQKSECPLCHSRSPRRSLWRSLGEGGNPGIKAVLFDFDGTLTVPGLLDFTAIKKEIKCPDNSTILEFIAGLFPEKKHRKATAVLEAYESRAASMAKPNENAEETLDFLKGLNLKLGILTRNSMRSLKVAIKNFRRTSLEDFDVVITREHDLKLKPHPDGVFEAARRFGVSPGELAVVGDYIYDVQAGQGAGAFTVFIESNLTGKWPDPPADLKIRNLNELRVIFEG